MTSQEKMQSQIIEIYQEWRPKEREGWGELCGGITILENLMTDYTLNLNHHMTQRGVQLQNAGRSLGHKVLKRFGIDAKTRLGEFGRTSRGGPRAAARLMALLEPLHLESLDASERNKLLLFCKSLW